MKKLQQLVALDCLMGKMKKGENNDPFESIRLDHTGSNGIHVFISLTVMISQIRPAKHLNRFMFLLSF